MSLAVEPLQYVPPEKWPEVQEILKTDWPSGVQIYYLIERQKELSGPHNELTLYCLFGDALNGVVIISDKVTCYDLIVYSTNLDAEKLEEILEKTRVVQWKRYASDTDHTLKCIHNGIKDLNHEPVAAVGFDYYILDKYTPVFEDISIPPCITFDYINEEHVEMINSLWPYKYPHSAHSFKLLSKSKSGFGLYQNGRLICWVFVGGKALLTHLFTVQEHRKKGYAQLIIKLVSNIFLRKANDVFLGIRRDNVPPYALFKKLGFRRVKKIVHVLYSKEK